MAAENIAYRLIREPVTQVGHGAHDPVIAPPGIFLRHPHHQPLGFLVNSGTTPGFAKLRSVELVGDELSVPGQQRIRLVEPGLYTLLRFQKAAARGNYETGNQAFLMHLRFLTIVCCRSTRRRSSP